MIALRELMMHRELGLELRTAEVGLDAWVRWAHVVEDAGAIRGLAGSELVLSEGRWYRGPADCDSFVIDLVGRGASALALSPRSPIAWEPLVAACNHWRLPLIEVPRSTTLETVAEVAASLLQRRDDPTSSARAERSRALLAALEGGGGVTALLDATRARTGLRAWLLTQGAAFTPTGELAPADDDLRRLLTALAGASGVRDVELGVGAALALDTSCRTRAGGPRGHVIIETRHGDDTVEAHAELEQLAEFASLHLSSVARMRAARRPGALEILRRLGAGGSKGEDLRTWLRVAGLAARGHAACVVVQATAARPGDMDDLAAALEDMADSVGAPAIATASESEVVAIVVLPEESTSIVRAIGRFVLLTERVIDRINGVVGTSSVIATDGNDLVRALVEARQVCRLNALRMPETPGGASAPAEAPLSALLLRDDDNARATLHDAVLAPIVAYDSDRRSELMRTLDVFLSHNGSWHAAAAELAVHVNTIRYRLTRIEELTGRSLDSMADRVDFFVALRTTRAPPRPPPEQAPPPLIHEAERTRGADR